jgi:hypothetical protein
MTVEAVQRETRPEQDQKHGMDVLRPVVSLSAVVVIMIWWRRNCQFVIVTVRELSSALQTPSISL